MTGVKTLRHIATVGATGMAAAVLVAGCGSAHPHSAQTQHSTQTTTPVTGSSTPSSSSAQAAGPGGSATSASTPGTRPAAVPTPPSGAGGTSLPAPYPTPGRDPSQVADQSTVLAALPGSSASSCENVGTHTDLRSGSIAAGNFAHARTQYTQTVASTAVPEVDLYVIPQHAAKLSTLTITVDPTGAGPTTTLSSKSVEQADQWSYFAVQLPVPAAGGYQLTMASGTDRGCFLVTFSR